MVVVYIDPGFPPALEIRNAPKQSYFSMRPQEFMARIIAAAVVIDIGRPVVQQVMRRFDVRSVRARVVVLLSSHWHDSRGSEYPLRTSLTLPKCLESFSITKLYGRCWVNFLKLFCELSTIQTLSSELGTVEVEH